VTGGPVGGAGARRLQIALIMVGGSGVVLLFLPFAYDIVPVSDVLFDSAGPHWSLWWFALPAMLLPPAITAAYALWIMRRLPAWGNAAGWTLWGLALACTLGALWVESLSLPDVETLASMLACYGGGAWFGRIAGAVEGPPGGVLAAQSAYLANTGALLGEYFDGGDIGVSLAAITAMAYLWQFALAIRPRWAWLVLVWLPPLGVFLLSAS